MLSKKLLSYPISGLRSFPAYHKRFCTQQTPPNKDDSDEKGNITIKPKPILIGLVCVSWIFLLRLWYTAEEKTRTRAFEYYEQGGSMDAAPPEEYRREYADKLKRKMKRQKDKGGNVAEVTFTTKEDYCPFWNSVDLYPDIFIMSRNQFSNVVTRISVSLPNKLSDVLFQLTEYHVAGVNQYISKLLK